MSEEYTDASYCNEIFSSTACCNTTAAVEREMKNLNSKLYKLLDLKDNIRMRVIGLSWEYQSTHWSKTGNSFTPEELPPHFKMIVSKQRSLSIPTKPPVLLHVQKALPQVITQATEIFAMYAARLETSN